MSSVSVEGENNRTAGRDYYERYERHEHYYPAAGGQPPGGGEPPDAPLTLQQLYAMRQEARRDAFRKNVRRFINRPFLIALGLIACALVSAIYMLGSADFFLGSPLMIAVPIILIMLISFHVHRSRYQLAAINQAAVEADQYLHAIEVEIARRKFR